MSSQPELTTAVWEARTDQAALQALFGQAEKQGTLPDYAAAIATARKRAPKSDLLNYWYYRLRLGESIEPVSNSEEQTSQVKITPNLSFSRTGISLSAPRLTTVWGLVTGFLIWGWIELNRMPYFMDSDGLLFFTVLMGILGISMSLFLLQYVHRRTITLMSFTPLVLYLFTLLALQISPWQSDTSQFLISVLFIAVTVLQLLGTLYFTHAENRVSPTEAAIAFFYRVLEAVAVGGSICIILLIFLGLGGGLLSLIGIYLDGSLATLIICLLFGSAPFWSIAFVYAQESPLIEQKSVFSSENFLSNIVWVLLWVATVFLLLYLIILSPGRFDRILDTGNTVGLFGSIIVVLQALLFVARPTMAKVREGNIRLLSYGLLALGLIQIILGAVALYAISVRIGQYALTEERIVGLMVVVMLLLLAVWETVYLVLLSARRFDLTGMIRRQSQAQIITGITLVTVMLTALTFGNLGYWSMLSQIGRASQSSDPTLHLDRYTYAGLPVERASLLVKAYAGGTNQFRADALLTIYEMKQYWERSRTEDTKLNAELDRLAEISPAEWQDFIALIKTTNTLYDSTDQTDPKEDNYPLTYSTDTICTQQIGELLGYSKTESHDFCGNGWDYYRY